MNPYALFHETVQSKQWLIIAAGYVALSASDARAFDMPTGSTTTASPAIREPSGTYLLQAVDRQNVSDEQLQHPSVAGLSIRVRWAAVDTQDGFNWQWLEEQIARAHRFKKHYMLRLMTGVNSPRDISGEWFQNAPIPWNHAAEARLSKMISLLGKKFAKDELLTCVHLTSTANFDSAEMHLAPNLTSHHDYSSDKVIASWKTALDVYAEAFPTNTIALNVSIEPDRRGLITMAVVDLTKRRLGDRATFQHNSLKATTLEASRHHALISSLGAKGARVGFQMVGPSINQRRFGGSFSEAVRKGDRARAQYYEVYQSDIGLPR